MNATISIDNVEQWNDRFAREHDIDDYYARSGVLIRAIERRRLACIRRMVAAAPGDRILEVGCGGGHVLAMFPRAALTGVDVSGEMLARARRNLDGLPVRLLKGELHELDLPEAGFDKIICTEVLEHVVDPEDLLRRMRRLLAPAGRAVITVPNDHLVHAIKAVIRRTGLTVLPPLRRISWGGDEYHLHIWRRREITSLIGGHFRVAQVRPIPSRLLPIRFGVLALHPEA